MYRSLAVFLFVSTLLHPDAADAQIFGLLDPNPPTLEIVAPPAGTISGAVALEAKASDGLLGSGVAAVEFQVDSAAGAWTALDRDLLGSRWSGSWDSRGVGNGQRTLYFRARDRAGNVTIAWVLVTVSNPPQAPGGLQVTAPPGASDGNVLDLSWQDAAEDDVSGWHVWASNVAAGPYSRIATVYVPSHRDTTAIAGQTQYYQVSAFDWSGNESERSAVASGIAFDTLAPVIDGPTARVLSEDSVELRWSTHELSLAAVEWGQTSALGNSTPVAEEESFDHLVVLSGLQRGVTYYYRVRAEDESGNVSHSPVSTFEPRVNEAPSVSILEPADGAYVIDPQARLRASAVDDAEIAYLEFSVGGTVWEPMAYNAITGEWEGDLASAPDGEALIGLRVFDSDGASALAVVQVFLDRHGPTLQIVSPEEDAHLPAGEVHTLSAFIHDETLVSAEWQLYYVPANLEVEVAPPPDPAAWSPLSWDFVTSSWVADWPTEPVATERVVFVYFRAVDASGRTATLAREVSLVGVGREFSFVGTGGQTLTGTVAVVGTAPDAIVGMELRCRGCDPGADYEVRAEEGSIVHVVGGRADERGRLDAILEENTSLLDAENLTLTPAGPGF